MGVNYIDRLADAVREAIPVDARPDTRATELYRLYALLVLTTGVRTTSRNVHDAWSAWMSAQNPHHPALRPFEELDIPTQEADLPYVAAVIAVAQSRGDLTRRG